MKRLDRVVQRLRFAQAARHLEPGARVLDVGAGDGALFAYLGHRLGAGVGLEPELDRVVRGPRWEVRPGRLPGALRSGERFDAVTLLAVLEHIPPGDQPNLVHAIADALEPNGTVVVTVPTPAVDPLLHLLIRARLFDGMEAGQHYGFAPRQTAPLFEAAGFVLERHRRFELGLNHLFTFRRSR